MQATKKSKYMQNHNDIKQPFKKKSVSHLDQLT